MMKILLLLEMCFFVILRLKKAILEKEPIVEIPQAINDRMLFRTQRFGKVQNPVNLIAFSYVDVGVGVNKQEDKKYFLFSNNPIFETGTYLVGFYILKDI